MAEFKMPALGADMERGTIVEWLVKPGDKIDRGDLIAVIETQKGEIDVEIFDSGVVTELLADEGDEVPVGTPIAVIDGKAPEEREAAEAPAEEPAQPVEPDAGESETAAEPSEAVAPGQPERRPERREPGRIRASPAARRLADEHGLDLSDVRGTGPDNAITLSDVQKALEVEEGPVEAAAGDRLAEMRRAIATVMARSKREIPHYYLGHEIDLRRAMAWLEEVNATRSVRERLVYAALLFKAVALAVHEVPEMNGYWVDDRFDAHSDVHVGVAISLRGGGLVAPAIHNTDQRSLDEIVVALRDLVQRARTGRLRGSEVSDATITVTNLGEQGVEHVYGVIYPPQVALVGFGTVIERPRVENGGIFIRPTISASLSADHRASVGHLGARFLSTIDRLLQEPDQL